MTSLAQLVLLLSSDKDGEVAAAARAIGKALVRDGCDWHRLADCIGECPHCAETESKPKPKPVADWDERDACDITATAKQDTILRRIATKLAWSS